MKIDNINISISTDGKNPELTKELKNLLLNDIINDNYNFEKRIKEIYYNGIKDHENNRK